MRALLFSRPRVRALIVAGLGLVPGLALALGLVLGLALASVPAFARGPEAIADTAEKVIGAVVNISTSQTVKGADEERPKLPEGSPFEEFFDDFFNNQGAPQGENPRTPRKVNSLGSGFIIDASGIVVTNNHVISDADEIHVILNDGTKLDAKLLGRDKKTDLALLKVKSVQPLPAVKFGDSDRLRLGEWVIAIGNPFSLGGSVSAGIVSARNRDIKSGPYDNYIQTDAAINRGNSGGPLFNLDGEVVGVNTAIFSPSGGSIGIGFAVPAKTAIRVIDQLRQFGETRRGWLGVRIQQVTDEIAASLSLGPARGALVAGIDDKGPARPAGLESGDVIIRFDGTDIVEMRDLPRAVADTPIGKDVDVVIIRKGKELTRKVKLGRLEDHDDPAKAAASEKDKKADKPVAALPDAQDHLLGLDLAALTGQVRARFNIKAAIKGVVVLGVTPGSQAEDLRLSAGDVIVECAQEAVTNVQDIQRKLTQLKKDKKTSVLLLVANNIGDLRFVALNLQ